MRKRKSFKERYKDVRNSFILGIIVGFVFLVIGISQMITNVVDIPSIFF